MSCDLPLNGNVAPIRERRAGGITAYAGTAAQLLEDTKNGKLKVLDRKFSQSWCCSHVMALTMMATISDAVIILHSAAGCVANLLQRAGTAVFHPRTEVFTGGVKYTPGKPANWYCSNLLEEDIILGSENKLIETIKMADKKHNPKSIFITNSCAAGIRGDDLEGVVKQVQPEVNAVLVPVRCESVASACAFYGYDAFGHAILKYLTKAPANKQDDLLNLFCGAGTTWDDRVYLTRLLARVGIRTNVVSEYATTQQLQILSEAALSTAISSDESNYLVKGLGQKYGVPYMMDASPIGIAKTEEWLRKIAPYFHKEEGMEKLIAEEKAAVLPQLETLRDTFRGLRVFVSTESAIKKWYLPYMLVDDFGMNIAGLNFFSWDESGTEPVEDLIRKVGNGDFFVHVGDARSTFEVVNYIRKLGIDLALMHRGPLVSTLKLGLFPVGVTHVERHKLRSSREACLLMGFRGVISFGKYVSRLLKNPSFGKTLANHVELPYKPSWYEANAFSKFVGRREIE